MSVLKKPAAKKAEDSRSQIMCRTGKPGEGQNHAIKYAVAGGKAAAVKLANAWLVKQKK